MQFISIHFIQTQSCSHPSRLTYSKPPLSTSPSHASSSPSLTLSPTILIALPTIQRSNPKIHKLQKLANQLQTQVQSQSKPTNASIRVANPWDRIHPSARRNVSLPIRTTSILSPRSSHPRDSMFCVFPKERKRQEKMKPPKFFLWSDIFPLPSRDPNPKNAKSLTAQR